MLYILFHWGFLSSTLANQCYPSTSNEIKYKEFNLPIVVSGRAEPKPHIELMTRPFLLITVIYKYKTISKLCTSVLGKHKQYLLSGLFILWFI